MATQRPEVALTRGKPTPRLVAAAFLLVVWPLSFRPAGETWRGFLSPCRRVCAAEPANTSPTVTHIPRKAVDEDGRRRALFVVGDAESAPGSLRVRARSSDQELLPDARIRIAGIGALRRLVMEPAANRFGAARVTVIVSDGLLRARESFLLVVRPVNDAPRLDLLPPPPGIVGAVYSHSVSAIDEDPGDVLSITAPLKPAWLDLVPGGNGLATLTGVPSPADAGDHRVELLVADAAGFSDTRSLTITVPSPPPVAGPTFEPGGGTFDGPVLVTISSATPGASLRYTTDGSTPLETAGTLYTAPVTVTRACTLKAVAYLAELPTSAVTSAGYAFSPGVSTAPADAPGSTEGTLLGEVDPRGLPSAGWFEWGTDPLVSSPASTPPVDVGDGVVPVAISFVMTGLAPGETRYYRAVASNAAGTARGEVRSLTAPGRVAAPVLVPPGGEYGSPVEVILSSDTAGAQIRYTTDGTIPSETAGTPYTGPVTVTSACVLRAVAFLAGRPVSEMVSATYALSPQAETAAAESVGPTGGTLRGAVNPRGLPSTGWFEWDVDPLLGSPAETPPVDLGSGTAAVALAFAVTSLGPGESCYYRTVAANAVGTVRGPTLAFTTPNSIPEPEFTPPGGTFDSPAMLSISSPTEGALIRYTLDGTLPTPTGGKLYGGPIVIGTATRVNALAYVESAWSSAVASADFFFTPSVHTLLAADVATTRATLHGRVNPRGSPVTGWFEWGTDPALGTCERTGIHEFGPSSAFQPFSDSITGLTAGFVYYYRAVATGSYGHIVGDIRSFSAESPAALVVNSAEDTAAPPPGTVTLRSAIARIGSGGTISFDPSLNGRTIDLANVGEEDTILKGEVFVMAVDPDTGRMGWRFEDFQERNYGRSALYARKDLTIDARDLPAGITLRWAGEDAAHARVLAVYGNLTMWNVTVTSGHAEAGPLDDDPSQPFSLGRGGGLAVWGRASLHNCVLAGNRAVGDSNGSRDRGAFGGGIYADTLELDGCVVSGNTVAGYGAAGGGVYSVGGREAGLDSTLKYSSITGNRVTAQHAYGGGAYSDGGGPGNLGTLYLENCTIARNVVEDHPDIPQSQMSQYYYRGGGIYMSNGSLSVYGSTIVENAVTGNSYPFGGKPNMGGGAVAATIGNAHVVEDMKIWHSILTGNTVAGAPADIFTGSLLDFFSYGYNLIGTIDFSQMLVPVPSWWCLSRRHYPKAGDLDGVAAGSVLHLGGVIRHPTIVSAGADAGGQAVLWYPPLGDAVDRVPPGASAVSWVWVGYTLAAGATADDFPDLLLEKLRADHAAELGADFMAGYDTSAAIWHEVAYTWPSLPENAGWIQFWHDVDTAIGNRLGTVGLGDEFWNSFTSGPFGENVVMEGSSMGPMPVPVGSTDQLGNPRYAGATSLGDVGAVEVQP